MININLGVGLGIAFGIAICAKVSGIKHGIVSAIERSI